MTTNQPRPIAADAPAMLELLKVVATIGRASDLARVRALLDLTPEIEAMVAKHSHRLTPTT